MAKRGRPDINLTISYLCTRVQAPDENDWEKLMRLMKYLNGTREMVLTLGADQLNVIKWYVDASYSVHPDYKSHTGCMMTMGTGAITTIS